MTRDEFRELILRKVGDGATRVNVTALQIEDCINEAVKLFGIWCTKANGKTFLSVEILQSDVDAGFLALPSNVLAVNILSRSSNSPLSGSSTRPDDMAIRDILLAGLSNGSVCSCNIFDGVKASATTPGLSAANYVLRMQQLSTSLEYTTKALIFDFNLFTKQLFIPGFKLEAGHFLLLEASVALDPNAASLIFSDPILQRLAASKIGIQWARNLMKYTNVTMAGGLSIDKDALLSYWDKEHGEAKEELKAAYNLPPLARFQ